MFHSRKMEHSINKFHERALLLIYPSDSKLTFKRIIRQKQNYEEIWRNPERKTSFFVQG